MVVPEKSRGRKRQQKEKQRKSENPFNSQVAIPYMAGVLERVDSLLNKHTVAVATCPQSFLRQLLVCPKDKCELQ